MVWVLRKLDWTQIGMLFREVNVYYFFISIVFFILSQFAAVFRFNLFVRNIGIRISFWNHSKLYLLGMFYNFFIPGGIGGDAYKVFILSKAYKKSIKSLGKIAFLDRFIGLVAIGFAICVLFIFIEIPFPEYLKWILIVTGIFFIGIILRLTNKFFHTHKKRIYVGFLYSILSQCFQMLCVLFIMLAFKIDSNFIIYLTMFLVSSVLSIVSFAGIGIREAVFYYGAHWLNFNQDTSTIIALSFSLMTMAISFAGIYFVLFPIRFKSE